MYPVTLKKTSNMEWYKDIDNAIFPTEDDKEKNIYRIIPFDTLLQMLTEHKNYLVKTSKWEDSYENFFLKETFMHKGKLVLFEEKDRLIEQYGVVHCTKEELDQIDAQAVIGRKIGSYGAEAIVLKTAVPKGMLSYPIDIEKLFIFMIKERE